MALYGVVAFCCQEITFLCQDVGQCMVRERHFSFMI